MQARGVIDDVGRHLAITWKKEHPDGTDDDNPWSLPKISKIKDEFDANPEATRVKYPELFYYFDGLIGTKISQSVHPAGMVISPINLNDNYGTFDKDGENCLMLDMDNIHDYTGLAKYDFLILNTVQIIRDTCNYIGRSYPKTHEINWNDDKVWESMLKSPVGIFQMESDYAYISLKKFKPKSIFDMALLSACLRPSGASYRDDLMARKQHKNPSSLIDELLKDNYGFLVYQEDTIKFLQEICGLSGSAADNVRRGIGRKKKEVLDEALPSILEGYCNKSDQPREIAEQEAKEFLQIIEDSASYQFGYNHAIAYCLLGYLCAYFRYYNPVEFLTSYLNNAANDDDIKNGTVYANSVGVKVTMPKWGLSKSDYFYDSEKKIIAKGLSSIKYMSKKIADELYSLSENNTYTRFVDLLNDIFAKTCVDRRQLEILIKIDFFSDFGNQRELLRITEMFVDFFKKGQVKKINKLKIDGTQLEPVIKKYAVGVTKSGGEAKSYTMLDTQSALREVEDLIKQSGMTDLSDVIKIHNFAEAMGYMGYVSGKDEDRRKLYILDTRELRRKKDYKQFGYSVYTKSVGSGIESRFTVFNKLYNENPIHKDDLIYCDSYSRDGQYFTLTGYRKLY